MLDLHTLPGWFTHTLITLPVVILGLFLNWALGWPAHLAAFAMTFFWLSREQYWEELKLRKEDRRSVKDLAWTMVMVFRPIERNMDFLVPVVLAWLLTMGYVQLVWENM